MTQYILETLELAKRMRPTDTAALVLAANHVAGQLRRLAAQLTDTAGGYQLIRQHSAHLDRLAAQLHAALVARPEVAYLEEFAQRLRLTPDAGTPTNGHPGKGGA